MLLREALAIPGAYLLQGDVLASCPDEPTFARVAFGVERCEEQSSYSPSTISAETAGLVATADITRINGDMQSANDASPA